MKVVKNKVAPPFKQAVFDILYGEGISREGELLDLGIGAQCGRARAVRGTPTTAPRLGQGKDNAREFLKQHPDVALEIENRIRALKGMKNRPTSLTPGEPAPIPVKNDDAKPQANKPAAGADPDMLEETVIEPDELFE